MTDRVPPRIFVLLAEQAPAGVIIRRGPTKWSHLTKWNTQTDKMEKGQWLSARVYERRCDINPDASLLAYFGVDNRYHSQTKGAFTAVSKPPYWAALALWPKGNTEGGGGVFLDKTTLYLNQPNVSLPSRPPTRLKILTTHPDGPFTNHDLSIYYARLRRDGWKLTAPGKPEEDPRVDTWVRTHPRESLKLIKEAVTSAKPPYGYSKNFDKHALEIESKGRVEMPDVEWADFDQAGRLVFVRDGGLYAGTVAGGQIADKLLLDFNADAPAPIQAPRWAQAW